jgi:hypothetical protein
VLARRPVVAVAHGPRAGAAWLQDQIEPGHVCVRDLPARCARPSRLDPRVRSASVPQSDAPQG